MSEEQQIDELNQAFNAFITCCRLLKTPFQIKHAFKLYNETAESCTVLVANKSFTNRYGDCLNKSLTDATFYLIDTFSALNEFKILLDQKRAEKAKTSECVFDIIKFTPIH